MGIEAFKAIQAAAHQPGEVDYFYPDWMKVTCGCCAGIEWGGEEPRECRDCVGGVVFVHRSGVVAQWPGGPFNGDHRPECWERLGGIDDG